MGGRTLFGLRRVKDFNHTLSLRWYLSCLYPGDCRKQDYQENGQLGCSHDSLQRRALCVPVSYLPMLIVLEEIATAGCFESPRISIYSSHCVVQEPQYGKRTAGFTPLREFCPSVKSGPPIILCRRFPIHLGFILEGFAEK